MTQLIKQQYFDLSKNLVFVKTRDWRIDNNRKTKIYELGEKLTIENSEQTYNEIITICDPFNTEVGQIIFMISMFMMLAGFFDLRIFVIGFLIFCVRCYEKLKPIINPEFPFKQY